MSLIRIALLAAVGAILAIAPAHACDYSMKSDVTAEAPIQAAPVAQATAPAAVATESTAPGTTLAAPATAPAQTANAETGTTSARVTN